MWIEAIVMSRQEPKPPRPASRRTRQELHHAGHAEGEQLHKSLLDYLRKHQLLQAVKWVSEPGSLPLVTLQCKQYVLEQLQQAPQFEAGRSLGGALNS